MGLPAQLHRLSCVVHPAKQHCQHKQVQDGSVALEVLLGGQHGNGSEISAGDSCRSSCRRVHRLTVLEWYVHHQPSFPIQPQGPSDKVCFYMQAQHITPGLHAVHHAPATNDWPLDPFRW